MSSDPSESFLALLLDAPLQSWGSESRFQRRMTGSHPSKSAVLGMVAAALGIDREDDARLGELAGLRMDTYLLPKRDPKQRPLRTLRLLDYHPVGGGYDKKTQPLQIPRKASGGSSDNAVVTTREYLLESRFAVILAGDPALVSELAAALGDPVWGVWLGRKCCIPAAPVLAGVFASKTDALREILRKAGLHPDTPEEAFDRTSESQPADPAAQQRHDVPLAFAANDREFGVRFVRRNPPRRAPERPNKGFDVPGVFFDGLPENSQES